MKGVVSFISENDWEDRRKGETIKLYSFKIEGDETWYRTGQEKPIFEKGQSIQFDVGPKNNVKMESVSVLEEAVKVAPKASTATARTASSSGSREGYWEAKEARDLAKDERYQNVDIPRMTFCTSQDAAVTLAVAALQHDCLPKLGTIAKSGRLGALLAYVDELTDRFFKQRMAAKTDTDQTEQDEPAENNSKGKSLDD